MGCFFVEVEAKVTHRPREVLPEEPLTSLLEAVDLGPAEPVR